PLETYPDYNEALKEKECFTYKLGEEFIKASKNWYGGGLFLLPCRVFKLHKKLEKKQ
ncbi:alpha-2,3-sialyltransferase, partial [Campylobacter sp. 107]